MSEIKEEAAKEAVSKQEGPRSFAEMFRHIDGGSFAIEVSKEVYDLNAKLEQIASGQGKAKGELTIKLKFEHDNKGRVDVATDLTVKSPKEQRSKSVFWMTRGGNLSPNNPKQVEMNFRDVNKPAEPARDVAPVAAAAARSV